MGFAFILQKLQKDSISAKPKSITKCRAILNTCRSLENVRTERSNSEFKGLKVNGCDYRGRGRPCVGSTQMEHQVGCVRMCKILIPSDHL